jgi:hypothetical protein
MYIHNLGYVEVLSENAINKSVNTTVCIPDLVIIKHFGNNTIEIKRIVCTYLDLLPSALVFELELINVYRTVGIHLLLESCDIRSVLMASWNRGFFL